MYFIGNGISTALRLVLFLFLGHALHADSLVSVNDINFHSELEKQSFEDIQKGNVDLKSLYLSGDNNQNILDRQHVNSMLFNHIDRYKSKDFDNPKKAKKYIKKIYLDIHKSFLREYDHDGFFSSIFSDGRYRSVTASMLFAVVFDELNIPFDINMLPSHIYLTSLPESVNYTIETTDPIGGASDFNDYFKSEYVNYLLNMNLLEADEYNTNSTEELFSKYYMQPESISPVQLAGFQYYNRSLKAISEFDFAKGHDLMVKAYFLDPSMKNEFMLLFSLAKVIGHTSLDDTVYADYLSQLMCFHNRGVSSAQLFELFSNLTNRQLLLNGNMVLYDKSFRKIIHEIQDKTLRDDIAFHYNYERGKLLYMNGYTDGAEKNINLALQIKPENPEAKALFYGMILTKLEQLKQGDDAYAFDRFQSFFTTLTEYKDYHEHLYQMNGFRKAWLYFCLGLMEQAYKFDDPVNGEKYRLIFETEYPEPLKGYNGINNGIVNAYSSAAEYYLKMKNPDRTMGLVTKGLDYLPGNQSLTGLLN